MIGIQAGAVSFVDEGTERVLDNLQRLASVNTLFLATFTYGRGIGGRQPRGSAFPITASRSTTTTFTAASSPRRTDSTTQHEHPSREGARSRRLRRSRRCAPGGAQARHESHLLVRGRRSARTFPGFDAAREVTLVGRPSTFACSRNPNTRNFWLGMVEDYLRSYDVDGLMWGSERQGPLGNAVGANHGGLGAGGGVACFCQYCIAAAKQQGIDVERAKSGYLELYKWCDAMRSNGARPTGDGAFVTFWRLLTKYPEIMAWERLWNEALNDTYRDMYARAKSIAPSKGIGWHIWHNNSFSPFYRAEQDYGEFQKYADFLKVVIYNLCGRRTPRAVRPKRAAHHLRRSHAGPGARFHLRCAAVSRQAARASWPRRALGPTTCCAKRNAPSPAPDQQ
jgi:hypothetical protein